MSSVSWIQYLDGFIVYVYERIKVLDEARSSICHVFMGGPFLSTLELRLFISCSLTAFCRQMDHFSYKHLSRIFTVFTKAKKKKRVKIQLKNILS